MLFNSYIFILLFLPLCIAGYFLLNRTGRYSLGKLFLTGMSLWFYAYLHPYYLLLILSSVGVNYALYVWLRRVQGGQAPQGSQIAEDAPAAARRGKPVFLLSLAFNLGLLFYFKYMDFFLENVNALFRTKLPLLHIALPLGISFFTFQQISFQADACRGETPRYSLLDYACYVTFFPQLVAGPIVTHDELIPQLQAPEKKRFHWDSFSRGIYLFALGLAKKVLLADTFGNAVDLGWTSLSELDSTNALLTALGFAFQIYFDFSGYCDMAVGIGKMLNIELPENFRSPYKSLTVAEFWERWHITLNRFFLRYVYIPLGGSRKGKGRTIANVMVVFLASGLWHGANWTYVLWGALNGILVVITRTFRGFFQKIPRALNWMITFGYFNFTLIIFRAESIRDAAAMMKAIAALRFGAVRADFIEKFQLPEFAFFLEKTPIQTRFPGFLLVAFYLFAFAIVLASPNAYEKAQKWKPTALRSFSTAFLLAWCVFSLSGVSIFLYFNF